MRSLAPDGVPLHAEWIDLKGVSAAAVVERIQHDLDRVVVANILPARFVRAHLSRPVEAHKDHIEIFLVVTKVGIGSLGNRRAVVRVALHKSGNPGHLRGDLAGCLHGEEVADVRWSREPGNHDGGWC